jgi:hypothetical protein
MPREDLVLRRIVLLRILADGARSQSHPRKPALRLGELGMVTHIGSECLKEGHHR